MSLKLNTKYLAGFVGQNELDAMKPQIETAVNTLHAKNGQGSDFLGWLELPTNYDKEEFDRIKKAAENYLNDIGEEVTRLNLIPMY